MPHQDDAHFRKNLETLKGMFERLLPTELSTFVRHGNASLEPPWLAAVAIVCWGWTPLGTLNDRVEMACSVMRRLWNVESTVTRQGLLKALAGSGEALVEIIVDGFAATLPQLKGAWSRGGKVNVAVDGSKMKAPRTDANQREFAAGKRARQSYKTKADASKAATVQVLMTVFWHLGTGLPLRWKLTGSTGSERNSVRETIDQLPSNARLIGDAEYVGYPLWSTIIQSQKSFLFRVGSNIRLLKNLGRYRLRDGYIYFWPERVMRRNQPPLVLRLFQIHNGRKTLYLVTNELNMTEELAGELYRQRWGIEVFFRAVKQSCQRRKLHCGVPHNVLSELNWTLLGIWSAMYFSKETLHTEGIGLHRASPVKVMRAFALAVQAIHLHARHVECLTEKLIEAIIVDESGRKSSKQSRNYPRKKQHRACGAPHIESPTTLQKQNARKLGL